MSLGKERLLAAPTAQVSDSSQPVLFPQCPLMAWHIADTQGGSPSRILNLYDFCHFGGFKIGFWYNIYPAGAQPGEDAEEAFLSSAWAPQHPMIRALQRVLTCAIGGMW